MVQGVLRCKLENEGENVLSGGSLLTAKYGRNGAGYFVSFSMVGRLGFEPRTNDLKGRCSTIELPTPSVEGRLRCVSPQSLASFFLKFSQ